MHGIYIDKIEVSVKADTRKKALEELSKIIAKEIKNSKEKIFNLLLDKEYHAGSGIGNGVSIPQFKLKGLKYPSIIMMVLNKPVSFEANDRKPVDIICALLSPESDGSLHLQRLSRLTRTLNDQELCTKIREAKDPDTIHALLKDPEGWMLAA